MLRKGRVVAVGSFAPVDTAKVMIMYSIIAVTVMKRRMARRFLEAVQRKMRRL